MNQVLIHEWMGLASSVVYDMSHTLRSITMERSSNDDDDEDNQVEIWTREETSLLQVDIGNPVLQ
jgi:hypothetical protein